MEQLNYMDIAVVVILLAMGGISCYKGFVKSALGFIPMTISMVGSYICSPYIVKILKAREVYSKIQAAVIEKLSIDELINNAVTTNQNELINSINAPGFIKDTLIKNNNSVVYDILSVTDLKGYIGGFIANICVNILAVIIAFFAIYIISSIILMTLDLVADAPYLSLINHTFGFLVGVIKGVIFIWIIGIFLTFFFYNPNLKGVFEVLNSSKLALLLYENNYLLFLVLKIFA